MRPSILAFMILLLPFSTLAKADIVATCYNDCEAETDSNPTFKACLSRTANKADRLLNQSYQTLQETIRKAAKDMDQPPDSATCGADCRPEAKDRLSRRELQLRGQPRLRRHGHRRQLFRLPLRLELRAH